MANAAPKERTAGGHGGSLDLHGLAWEQIAPAKKGLQKVSIENVC